MSAAPDGIDTRILGRERNRDADRRTHGTGTDVSRTAWPPPSKGPLPPADRLPPDLNVYSAHDEIDAWAHEHDAATELLAEIRERLVDVQVDYMRQKALARRRARANPTERGRRTSEDISTEVDEALVEHGIARDKLDLETQAEIALGRLFRARDNVNRLDSYIRSLPRTDHRP